jgi:hypothetical protein
MSPLAVFGITSDGLSLVVNLLLLFLVVFWIALVYWTYSDARRRIADPMLVGCATAASLFPFAGTLVYMIVRPPEYLDDVRERELEIAAAEVRLAAVEHLSCAYCNFQIEQSFLRCPNCLRRLKEPCTTCHKPLAPNWKICPYCESEIDQPAPQPRRRARPREAPVAAVAPERKRQPAASRQRPAERQRPAAGAQEGQPSAPAPRAPRRVASEGGRAASSAQRQSEGRPAGVAPRAAGQGPRAATPAANGPAKRETRAKRPAPSRPTAADGSQRPSGSDRQKRSGTPAAKRPASQAASEAATSEQPVVRPRTRPPSAG